MKKHHEEQYFVLLDKYVRLENKYDLLKQEYDNFQIKHISKEVDDDLHIIFELTDSSEAEQNKKYLESGDIYMFLSNACLVTEINKAINKYGYNMLCNAITYIYDNWIMAKAEEDEESEYEK